MATDIDTLSTYEAIAAAGVEDKGARAISKAIADHAAANRADLATKTDVESGRVKLEAEFTLIRSELKTLGADIGKTIADAQNVTVKWTIATGLSVIAVIIAAAIAAAKLV